VGRSDDKEYGQTSAGARRLFSFTHNDATSARRTTDIATLPNLDFTVTGGCVNTRPLSRTLAFDWPARM